MTYNEELFQCLEKRTRDELGSVEEITYDDISYKSITLSGEEDYTEFYYINPKDDKISIGLVHDYTIGAIDGKINREKYAKYLREIIGNGCWIEDEYELDDDMWLIEVNCNKGKDIKKPLSPIEACDNIIDEFWNLQSDVWAMGTKDAWETQKMLIRGELPL